MLFDSFTAGGYKALSGQIATDRCVNLYPEQVQSGTGKAKYALLGAPGTTVYVTLAGGPIRALASSIQGSGVNEYLIAIAGANVYKVDNIAGATLLGTVLFAGGAQVIPAQIIPYNQNKAFILSDGLGYIADLLANTITPVTLPIGFARTATTLDTYMMISDVASRNFYISAPGDPTSWNPADVATKEANPDFLQQVFASSELLWLFGLETTEIWYNSGAALFPFQRYPGGGVLEVGTAFLYSICKVGDALMWVGRDGRGQNVVYMARGLQYQRVSNHAVEAALNSVLNGAGVGVAYSYQENGHFFYVLNSGVIPSGIDITWVYDMATNMWHERGLWDGSAYHRQNWQYHTMAYFASTNVGHYVAGTGVSGDTSGIVYRQQMNIYDFNGSAKRVLRVSPHLTGEQRRVRYNNVILDLDKASNPVLNLRSSNDGGTNFGATHTITAPNGESRAIWRNLGSARDKVIEISSQTACLQAWAAAYVNERAPAP